MTVFTTSFVCLCVLTEASVRPKDIASAAALESVYPVQGKLCCQHTVHTNINHAIWSSHCIVLVCGLYRPGFSNIFVSVFYSQ